jgi:hypothetical protein
VSSFVAGVPVAASGAGGSALAVGLSAVGVLPLALPGLVGAAEGAAWGSVEAGAASALPADGGSDAPPALAIGS